MKIGFNPNFAPFSYLKDGKAAGIVIDRIRGIFERAEIEPEFIAAELTGLTKGLMSGEFDLLAAMAKTEARTKTMSFTKPVIVSGAAWFMPIDLDILYNDGVPDKVVTPKVGPLVAQIKSIYPEIEIVTCDDYDDALKLTLYGNVGVVAAALNWHVGRMLIEENYKGLFHIPKAPFNTMPLYMVTRTNDENRLVDRLNTHIPADWGPDPL